MKSKIIYISELDRSFTTAEAAIADDNRLPEIIAKYKDDLRRMEDGLEMFGRSPVTNELKEQWRKAIFDYELRWEAAKSPIDVPKSMKIRFGQIKRGKRFTRDGSPHVWKRTQGRFAIRVDLIGTGRGECPIDLNEMVMPVA